MKEILEFMKFYEEKSNSHDFSQLEPIIHPQASYLFSEGSYLGLGEIKKAFMKTWNKITEEKYEINDVKIITVSEGITAVYYNFTWQGIINGTFSSGDGRGTNILVRENSRWLIKHEHLSK